MKITENISAEIAANPSFLNIMSRHSVRRYLDMPISDEQLTALLHAGMAAPSGVNKQPWDFIVIDDKDLLASLVTALPKAKMAANAPFAIIVCGNKDRFLEGEDNVLWEQDCSAASENILLAANALGLGAVWTCLYPHEDRIKPVREILNIPDNLIPFNLIPVGHPANAHSPINKWHPDRVHFNTFGEK